MQNLNIKLGISGYLGIFFILFVFSLMFFRDSVYSLIVLNTDAVRLEESQKTNKKIAELLISLDKIKFDTTVLQTPYLQSLTRLQQFPIDAQTLTNFGKANPFIGNFIVAPVAATTSVGAVIYSNQREVNNGNAVIPVTPNRVRTR